MIRREKDMIIDLKENMRDGKGAVEILHIFKNEELSSKTRLFAKVRLNPNCSVGLHPHDGEEEIYYILKGTAKVDDDGEEKILYPGDAMQTGNGATHSIENIGKDVLEFMASVIMY